MQGIVKCCTTPSAVHTNIWWKSKHVSILTRLRSNRTRGQRYMHHDCMWSKWIDASGHEQRWNIFITQVEKNNLNLKNTHLNCVVLLPVSFWFRPYLDRIRCFGENAAGLSGGFVQRWKCHIININGPILWRQVVYLLATMVVGQQQLMLPTWNRGGGDCTAQDRS